MSRTLFQISDDLRALEELLSDLGGEITDDLIGQELEAWFDRLGEERDAKINGYCWLISELQGRADVREEAAKHLLALAASDANNAKRLKNRLKGFLDSQGLKKLETAHFRLTIANNGGALPLLLPAAWANDPVAAPEAFQKKTITLDSDVIRSQVAASVDGLVCPSCGEDVVIDAAEEGTDSPSKVACICSWTGAPEEAARFGRRGDHLRIR